MTSSEIRCSFAKKVLPAFAGSDFAVICVARMGAGTVCGLPWGLWGDNKGQPGSCARCGQQPAKNSGKRLTCSKTQGNPMVLAHFRPSGGPFPGSFPGNFSGHFSGPLIPRIDWEQLNPISNALSGIFPEFFKPMISVIVKKPFELASSFCVITKI